MKAVADRGPARRPGAAQAGTTLVEVLVTLVLVSVGLLGLVGLQLATVQNTNSAAQRFEATTLAQDILERMRANKARAVDGDYDIALGAGANGAGLAGDDLAAWKQALAVLPAGDGSIDVNNGEVTITVQWTDASNESTNGSRDSSVFLRTGL